MQDGRQTQKLPRQTKTTENTHMKFILSFLITGAILSASSSSKLSLGNGVLSDNVLCSPVVVANPTPIKCDSPTLQIPTVSTIKCDLPVLPKADLPVLAKCTPAPVICPTPVTPVIECPKDPSTPKCPTTPGSATPEPASYALLGAGLVTAGVAHRFRAKK
jgi:hypothetical protein